MLKGIVSNLPIVTKIGSVSSKFVALAMTGYGLSKIWSKENQEKHSLNARMAFSTAYMLHMGSTSLATAAWFGSEAVTPPTATALLATTSLLTSYVNLVEAYINHSLLNAEHTELQEQLITNECDLQRSLALLQSVAECEEEIQATIDQLAYLKSYNDRLKTISDPTLLEAKTELKSIYLALYENYQERANRNEMISNYFKAKKDHLNIDIELNIIREKINTLQAEIERYKTILEKNKALKTHSRLPNKIKTLEQELKEYGTLNLQCIRYIKTESEIKGLEELLAKINQDSSYASQQESGFLKERIATLQTSLTRCLQPPDSQALDLALGETLSLDTYVEDDPTSFKNSLEMSLTEHISKLEENKKNLAIHSAQNTECFNRFISSRTTDVQHYHSQIHQLKQEMVELKCSLSLERLNEENKKTKLSFSSIASIAALALCLLPKGELSRILNPLMLTVGILGGASSLWQFYSKNLLERRVESHKRQKTQCLKKAHAFESRHDMKKTRTAVLDKMLQTSRKRRPQVIEKRMLPIRASKEKAKALIFSQSTVNKRLENNQPIRDLKAPRYR